MIRVHTSQLPNAKRMSFGLVCTNFSPRRLVQRNHVLWNYIIRYTSLEQNVCNRYSSDCSTNHSVYALPFVIRMCTLYTHSTELKMTLINVIDTSHFNAT